MKQIKVVIEYRKEKYEEELANYISKGFKVMQSNITFCNSPIIYGEEKEMYNTTTKAIAQSLKDSFDVKKTIDRQSMNYHLIFYALLIKED